jgi:hypothetical protein
VDGSTNTRDPIDARRAHRWADDLSDGERRALERTVPLAALFGYPPDIAAHGGTGRLEPTSPRRWTLTGDDVAGLLERWDGRDDVVDVPPVPALDADPAELARRLSHVEAALARVRSRRAVRLADAARRLQHGRSWADVKGVWNALLRHPS